MRHTSTIKFLSFIFFFLLSSRNVGADLNNNQVINRQMASHIETLKNKNGHSSKDFNGCQITWTVNAFPEGHTSSSTITGGITLFYEGNTVTKLKNQGRGNAENIANLGLNCLEFNNHVYLFFDTIDDQTRQQFNLKDLSYVVYSSDKGKSWSELKSLHPFSTKATFVLPQKQFSRNLKIFGNKTHHVLSIFNIQDETTYLFDPDFKVLKTVPVYNRLSDFDHPSDFQYYKDVLYLTRGSCEQIKGRIRCPERTYLETSNDFGKTWTRETLPFMAKSHFLKSDKALYHFYFLPCSSSWFNIVPALNRSLICGKIEVRKLNILGEWEEPKILTKTADQLLGVYEDNQPIVVWKDFRFHKSRACGYIPLIGCPDSKTFKGPSVTYAAKLDLATLDAEEIIIKYK